MENQQKHIFLNLVRNELENHKWTFFNMFVKTYSTILKETRENFLQKYLFSPRIQSVGEKPPLKQGEVLLEFLVNKLVQAIAIAEKNVCCTEFDDNTKLGHLECVHLRACIESTII